MKVLAVVLIAIGSAAALGSGPYLPSGWRPQGPAFLLPGEVQKPAENPLKEVILFGSEASGSDSLREYGPPKIQEAVVNQGLPDVATEQSFLVVEDRGAGSFIEELSISQVATEAIQESTTDAEIIEEVSTIAPTFAEVEPQTETTAVTYIEPEVSSPTLIIEGDAIEAAVEEKLEQVVEEQVSTLDDGVSNIVEALTNLENNIKAEQVQSEVVGEGRSISGSVSAQIPEGFLEYGPPGFREYGPPKSGDLLRSDAVQESLESNDARRRRFSPKFRSTKSKRLH